MPRAIDLDRHLPRRAPADVVDRHVERELETFYARNPQPAGVPFRYYPTTAPRPLIAPVITP